MADNADIAESQPWGTPSWLGSSQERDTISIHSPALGLGQKSPLMSATTTSPLSACYTTESTNELERDRRAVRHPRMPRNSTAAANECAHRRRDNGRCQVRFGRIQRCSIGRRHDGHFISSQETCILTHPMSCEALSGGRMVCENVKSLSSACPRSASPLYCLNPFARHLVIEYMGNVVLSDLFSR